MRIFGFSDRAAVPAIYSTQCGSRETQPCMNNTPIDIPECFSGEALRKKFLKLEAAIESTEGSATKKGSEKEQVSKKYGHQEVQI